MTHQWMKNILYWSEELKKLHGELSDASDQEAETNPSHENTLHQLENQNITSTLNIERDDENIWRLVKQLNDEDNQRGSTTLEENGDMVTGKQEANRLADKYEDMSNFPVNMVHTREMQDRNKER